MKVGVAVRRLKPSLLSYKMRLRRVAHLRALLATVPPPVHLLDVGGTAHFWQTVGRELLPLVQHVTLLNPQPQPNLPRGVQALRGDGCAMPQLATASYAVVFSNSAIEHVGDWSRQHQMAREIVRVGQRYYVQTPARSFPIEPHYLFPFFQFLPVTLRVELAARLHLGWVSPPPSRAALHADIAATRMLTARELRALFPNGTLQYERFAGVVKSYTVYGGFPGGAVPA